MIVGRPSRGAVRHPARGPPGEAIALEAAAAVRAGTAPAARGRGVTFMFAIFACFASAAVAAAEHGTQCAGARGDRRRQLALRVGGSQCFGATRFAWSERSSCTDTTGFGSDGALGLLANGTERALSSAGERGSSSVRDFEVSFTRA